MVSRKFFVVTSVILGLVTSCGQDAAKTLLAKSNAIREVSSTYRKKHAEISDINEHLPTIARYALDCATITEFGMRGVVSTWAMLHGLSQNNLSNKRLVSVDLNYAPGVERIKVLASALDIDFQFVMASDLKIMIQPTDMLFIDTWHNYGQLKRELALHAKSVNKYILLHDTSIDGEIGESLRNGWDVNQEAQLTGFSVDEITKGLWPAVEEFLEQNPDWELEQRYTNNNGLTVLRKSQA